jgi:anion-transporting  ArsA/GET3 family ATPase
VRGLLERRLIFVTGKGGVGKSTVAIALGILGARSGRRTVVAELASQNRVGQTFAQDAATFEEVELADGLFTISIDPESAMEEYLRVKTGPVGQALGTSRLFQAFAMATPGMRELLSIGKVWELAQLQRRTTGADVYDLVIVDSPAAGHGLGILRTPRTLTRPRRSPTRSPTTTSRRSWRSAPRPRCPSTRPYGSTTNCPATASRSTR